MRYGSVNTVLRRDVQSVAAFPNPNQDNIYLYLQPSGVRHSQHILPKQ